jgi:monomeric sarcosine oxidase
MRIAIIGAGAVGGAAARFLANEGHAVTLYEQFTVDHDRGSSFGPSRIIRKTYPDPFYTALMLHAYPLWDALERDAGETLFEPVGGLFFGREAGTEMQGVLHALRENGVEHEVFDARSSPVRFPAFVLRVGEIAVFEREAGFLRASLCVRANARLAVRAGAVLREKTVARELRAAPSAGVEVVEAGGTVETFDHAIVTAGPWSSAVPALAKLPLRVTRQVYVHLEPAREAARFARGAFPIWIDFDSMHYGFPDDGLYPGIKIARHVPGDATDPDHVDREVHDRDREPLVAYARERLPDLSSRVVFEKVCLYTNTPDEDFVVDTISGIEASTFVAGLSGHGFKLSILLGRIAAWRATGARVPIDVSRFAAARFG